jgi:CheY-like chemotaxis protein
VIGKQMAKILIVEDEKALNEAYTIILTKEKHKVTSVFNGVQALEAVKKQTPDLILLDLRMPQMDGVEFLQNLKPLENYPKLKIIVFSNYDVQKDIDEAFKLGATRYMLKAWASPKELVRVVNDTLKKNKS